MENFSLEFCPFSHHYIIMEYKMAEERDHMKNDNKDLLSEIKELQERIKNLELSEGKRILAESQLQIAEELVQHSPSKALKRELEKLNAEAEDSLERMLGRSGKMMEVIDQIRRISKTDFTVLLQGETGVGKSFIANIIHNLSPRAHNPFIRIDMGTIPETLFESELFGYEKGAFTGADKNRKGLFELAAKGGTIFIDELENMTPYAQSKFLTVIEEKENTSPWQCGNKGPECAFYFRN